MAASSCSAALQTWCCADRHFALFVLYMRLGHGFGSDGGLGVIEILSVDGHFAAGMSTTSLLAATATTTATAAVLVVRLVL